MCCLEEFLNGYKRLGEMEGCQESLADDDANQAELV